MSVLSSSRNELSNMRQKEFIGRRLGTHRLTRKAAKPGLEMGRNWKVPKGWAEGPIER